jgi:hypothetical protein
MIAAVIPSTSRSTRVAPGQHTLKPLPSWAPEALAAGFEHPEPWCGSLPLRGSRATRHPAAASLPLTAATAVKRRGSAPLPHMSSLTIGPTLQLLETRMKSWVHTTSRRRVGTRASRRVRRCVWCARSAPRRAVRRGGSSCRGAGLVRPTPGVGGHLVRSESQYVCTVPRRGREQIARSGAV